MNYKDIKAALKDYNQNEVNVFTNYLESLKNENWFSGLKEKQLIDLYKKVSLQGVYIDGTTITLQNRKGKLMVSYGYQAYKNRMLHIYPETLIDIQNVYKGDVFTFKKSSGKVIYTHELKDPFKTGREIIGAYCVIKNSRGEFIETINQDDIKKMRAVAKTQVIWNAWESEMIKKSIIKRACKTHFNDVVIDIEAADNENYDLADSEFPPTIKGYIEQAQSIEELNVIYKANLPEVQAAEQEPVFLRLLTEKRLDLKQLV